MGPKKLTMSVGIGGCADSGRGMRPLRRLWTQPHWVVSSIWDPITRRQYWWDPKHLACFITMPNQHLEALQQTVINRAVVVKDDV